jgi:hypothetical protein
MDPSVFDALARSFQTAGTRRRLLPRLVASLPLVGTLAAMGGAQGSAARRHNKQRNNHNNNNQNNNNNNNSGPPGDPGTTCAGPLELYLKNSDCCSNLCAISESGLRCACRNPQCN